MKKILITGGAGYIGSHQVKNMCDLNYEIVVIDNLSTGYEKAVDKRAKFIKGDVRDFDFINKVLNEEKVEGVIHFAALSLVGQSMCDPLEYYDNNVYGMEILLKAMVNNGVKNIVFSSTAAIYGEHDKMPILESYEEKPTNTYGETKFAMEKMIDWCSKAYNINYISLRYFNACGASMDFSLGENHNPETHLIPLILQVPLKKKEYIDVYGNNYNTPDGTCIRDYIHVEDLCFAHILAMEGLIDGKPSNIYNLGYGRGYSVMEIIQVAQKVVGEKIPYKIKDKRAGDPAKLIASSDKIKKDLGWTPKYDDLELIIKTAYEYYKNKDIQ